MNLEKRIHTFSLGLLLLSLVLIGSCQNDHVKTPQHAYLKQAFDSIGHYTIHRELNLDSVFHATLAQLSDTASMEELHNLLNVQVRAIDHHSFLMPTEEQKLLESGHTDYVPEPFPFIGKLLLNDIAYVEMRGFMGVDSTSADHYVDSLQAIINTLYAQKPSGWIIDLRGNTGGNPYAMLAGIGPILGEGNKCYTINYAGERHDYFYKRWDEEKKEYEHILLADSAHVFERALPVSVLIGPETGSAGEVLVLAFKGNDHTRIFGESTYGVSTGLTPCYLSDSACIYITSSIDYDRFGIPYGGRIEPEIEVHDPVQLFKLAEDWILEP